MCRQLLNKSKHNLIIIRTNNYPLVIHNLVDNIINQIIQIVAGNLIIRMIIIILIQQILSKGIHNFKTNIKILDKIINRLKIKVNFPVGTLKTN